MKLTPYLCRFIPEKHKYEIVNMYHTARIALSGTDNAIFNSDNRNITL